jgi:mRNA-degrading endonuclease RelE of RelBE toxin-antitoxin system
MSGRKDWRIRTSPEIRNLISRLHPEIKKKIKDGLIAILKNPGSGKQLKADLEGLFSYRIGKFRIIYRLDKNKIITIIVIGPRKTIYEATLILLKRDSKG